MNKLPYLKVSLTKLIENKNPDEEILVADGGSTDGTGEYLEELFNQGKIDGYISEKDYGESHALNKLFLKAQGQLITLVTDDDAFDYPTIQKCKKFMLDNCEIDLLGTNGAKKNQSYNSKIIMMDYTNDYNTWKNTHRPFMFCGLGIMMRRSSLPILGFWGIGFARADAEYSLRITNGKVNIAWYSGPSFVNISNPQSISRTQRQKVWHETVRLNKFYLDKKNYYPKFLVNLRAKLRKIRDELFPKPINLKAHEWDNTFYDCMKWLREENDNDQFCFIKK